MKNILKRAAIALAILILLLVVIAGGLHLTGRNRLDNAPAVTIATVEVPPADDATLERGHHLATISSCADCHGRNLEGAAFVDEAPIGYIPAPNLTPAGVGATYTDEAWAGAIRHGVGPEGRTLVIMPSEHYADYGDDDLAHLIAYLKSIPPAENNLPERQIQFPGTIIFGILAYDAWPVNQIDHAAVGGTAAPPLADSAEYGKYLVAIASCGSCHGENLAGNTPDSDSPQGPNITPGGDLGAWSYEQFAQALRSGVTPDGRRLDPEQMPWPNYSRMTDTELQALWTYIQSLEPLPDNQP